MRGKATENQTNSTEKIRQRNIHNVGLKLHADEDQGELLSRKDEKSVDLDRQHQLFSGSYVKNLPHLAMNALVCALNIKGLL